MRSEMYAFTCFVEFLEESDGPHPAYDSFTNLIFNWLSYGDGIESCLENYALYLRTLILIAGSRSLRLRVGHGDDDFGPVPDVTADDLVEVMCVSFFGVAIHLCRGEIASRSRARERRERLSYDEVAGGNL